MHRTPEKLEQEPIWKPLFSGGEFHWVFQMRLGDAESFFARQNDGGALLAEKQSWLDATPEIFTALAPQGEGLVAAAWDQAIAWGHVVSPENGRRDLAALARQWEPDVLLLDHETMSLAAACVCFPSSWSPAHAVGKSLLEVHGGVPRLNPEIGEKIGRFLRQLQPGKAYCRENWGFTRSAEMNYHPDRELPAGRDRLRSGGMADDGGKIRTMPEDMAVYKGLGTAREAMLREMRKLAPTGG